MYTYNIIMVAAVAADTTTDEGALSAALAEQRSVEADGHKPMAFRCLTLAHLDPGEPLGEDIVDAYARCIREWTGAGSSGGGAAYDIAPTLLFRIMTETGRGPRSLRDRLHSHRVVFLPALENGHWRLVVLVPAAGRVLVADSMAPSGPGSPLPRGFWEALRVMDTVQWTVETLTCPAQTHGSNDCGLHMLQNLEALYVLRRLLMWENGPPPDLCELIPPERAAHPEANRRLVRGFLGALRCAEPTDAERWRELVHRGRRLLTTTMIPSEW